MPPTDPRTMIRIARKAGGETAVEPPNLGERVQGLRRSLGWPQPDARR